MAQSFHELQSSANKLEAILSSHGITGRAVAATATSPESVTFHYVLSGYSRERLLASAKEDLESKLAIFLGAASVSIAEQSDYEGRNNTPYDQMIDVVAWQNQ